MFARNFFVAVLSFTALTLGAVEEPLKFSDPQPQRYELTARASEIDSRVRPHPEIDFVFEKDGKPADVQHASVNTRVQPQGKLVIWLMGPSAPLFERINSYGLHAIRVHYANGWFSKFGQEPPPADDKFLGKIRLEAATGEDFSDVVNIPKPDGMAGRALQFVKWLAQKNPQGRWEYFLTDDRKALRWERVIIAGSSHGATVSARFAKYQKVDRVVMFCGPRDQYETWQALPSATPPNRFFAFSHVLDGGWTGDHYCRSWQLLGLQEFGPVVNVDQTAAPYGHTRRLITDADVKNDPKRAHGCVVPGNAAVKDAAGKFIHEEVWRYLFTHPVEEVGKPVPPDADCRMNLRPLEPRDPRDNESTVWAVKENGLATYFVYGLAQTTNNTLLAFSEARIGSSKDETPHHLALKRSTDQGATWSDTIYIEEANGTYWKQLGVADRLECWAQPTPIVDRKTGRIFVFYAFNEGGSEEMNTQRFTHVFYKYSDDDGLTWSKRVNVTDLLNTKKDGSPNKDFKGEWLRDLNGFPCDWRGRAVHMPGPGHGLQLKGGRLLVQFWNRVGLVTNDGKHVPAKERKYGISLLYSDDNGLTWKAGPFLGDEFHATESRMVELDNGDIYLNMRTTTEQRGKRAVAIGSKGGLEWKMKGYDNAMPLYSPEDSGLAEMRRNGKQVLLFSRCGMRSRREQLILSTSLDHGETWRHKVIHEGGANYSDLVILPDGRIGLIYGNSASISEMAVKFLRINPAWLDL